MNDTSNSEIAVHDPRTQTNLSARVSSLALASISANTQNLLLRMFADPYLLEKEDRCSLVDQLRECVNRYPDVSELRVPNSFIAQLKVGELWMRLRAMDKAEQHTRLAGLLAQSMAQSELARRQAATIRTMRREGIERGGYKSPWSWIARPLRRLWTRNRSDPSVALDIS